MGRFKFQFAEKVLSSLQGTILFLALIVQQAVAADDDLVAAIRLTVKKHPSVISKLEELKSLGFDVDSAEAGRYPSISLQAQEFSSSQSQVVARLQQSLWAGGRIDGNIHLAEVRLKTSQSALLQVRRQLMEETAATYANLLGSKLRLGVAELNVAEHDKLLALITRRQAGSIASGADVRLAQSRLTQALTQKEQLNGLVTKTTADLQALTQAAFTGAVPVSEELLQLPVESDILVEAEKKSPVVQQKIDEIDIARTQADLRFAEMLPTLNAVVEQDVVLKNKNGNQPLDTRFGLVFSGNVEGMSFASYGKVKAASAMVEAAKRDVDSARIDVRRRALAYISDRNTYFRVAEGNNLLVRANQETLESFMRQYDAGRKSWVDVLNAQKELADARQSLELTKSTLMEVTLRLAVLIGRLDKYAGILP